ncbi:MAG: alpha/beta hydrolase, partial [Pseudomonadota bacterium]
GYFPGKRIGFAGSEARGVLFDWTATIRSGCYHITGLSRNGRTAEAEASMAALNSRALVLRMQHDGWVSQRAIDELLNKLPQCPVEQHTIGPDQSGRRANHFSWMRAPQACASRIAEWIRHGPG